MCGLKFQNVLSFGFHGTVSSLSGDLGLEVMGAPCVSPLRCDGSVILT